MLDRSQPLAGRLRVIARNLRFAPVDKRRPHLDELDAVVEEITELETPPEQDWEDFDLPLAEVLWQLAPRFPEVFRARGQDFGGRVVTAKGGIDFQAYPEQDGSPAEVLGWGDSQVAGHLIRDAACHGWELSLSFGDGHWTAEVRHVATDDIHVFNVPDGELRQSMLYAVAAALLCAINHHGEQP